MAHYFLMILNSEKDGYSNVAVPAVKAVNVYSSAQFEKNLKRMKKL